MTWTLKTKNAQQGTLKTKHKKQATGYIKTQTGFLLLHTGGKLVIGRNWSLRTKNN